MKNIQLHILSDSTFTHSVNSFMKKHNLKKTQILKKAINVLRFIMESETFDCKAYSKDTKPSFDEEINHFFTLSKEENDFLEHCAKVNGYFSKSDFTRDIIILYMTNVDIMTEEVYIKRLKNDKMTFCNTIRDLTKICSIRLKRFEYYIRSFSKDFIDYYFNMKYLQKYLT